MMETVIVLKPHDAVAHGATTWYSRLGAGVADAACSGASRRDRISTEQLVEQMNEALQLPGVTNAWTMPIKARIDMLTTGIRTPVGIKIYGADIKEIERIGTEIETLLPAVPGTRSVFAERTAGGYFLDFDWNRDELARYGLSIDDAQMVVMTRDRRRQRDHDRRRPRALSGERALLCATTAATSSSLRPRAGAGDGRPDAGPDRRSSPTCSSSAGRRCCATRTAC